MNTRICSFSGVLILEGNVEADVQFKNWDGIVLSNNATVISLDSNFEGILSSHIL